MPAIHNSSIDGYSTVTELPDDGTYTIRACHMVKTPVGMIPSVDGLVIDTFFGGSLIGGAVECDAVPARLKEAANTQCAGKVGT